jgi:hypothetical protein
VLQDQEVTVEFPPFDADLNRPRAIGRRLVTMVCVLALVLLGLALPGDSHASQLDGSQSVTTAVHGDGHCPGPMHGATGPGHGCASIHGHACCMLIEPARADAAAAKQPWGQPHEPRRTAVVIAPIPRPPAHLAA